jgi:hypothetical protein
MGISRLWRDDIWHKFVGKVGVYLDCVSPIDEYSIVLAFFEFGGNRTFLFALSTGFPFQDWTDLLIALCTNS